MTHNACQSSSCHQISQVRNTIINIIQVSYVITLLPSKVMPSNFSQVSITNTRLSFTSSSICHVSFTTSINHVIAYLSRKYYCYADRRLLITSSSIYYVSFTTSVNHVVRNLSGEYCHQASVSHIILYLSSKYHHQASVITKSSIYQAIIIIKKTANHIIDYLSCEFYHNCQS